MALKKDNLRTSCKFLQEPETRRKQMKIAVTSTGPTLDDTIETRFGRCAYFLVVDPDTWEFESTPNLNLTLRGGAEPQPAQFMANKGVSVVFTGHCGPNVLRTLGGAGIRVITGATGQVRQIVALCRASACTHG
jgi:predicted Fe-Mo cluster-binding NifX family protein